MPFDEVAKRFADPGLPTGADFARVRRKLREVRAADASTRGKKLVDLEALAEGWRAGHVAAGDEVDRAGLRVINLLLDEVPFELRALINERAERSFDQAVEAGAGPASPRSPRADGPVSPRGRAKGVWQRPIAGLTNEGKAMVTEGDPLEPRAERYAAKWMLTDQEIRGVRIYTAMDFGYINAGAARDYSRMGQMRRAVGWNTYGLTTAEIVDAADAWTAFASHGAAKLPRTWETTWRGLRLTMGEFQQEFFDPVSRAVPLQRWRARSLVSTSLEQRVAFRFALAFALDRMSGREVAVMLQFVNCGGAEILELSRSPDEREVLLFKGSSFRIDSIERADGPVWREQVAQYRAFGALPPVHQYLVTLINESPEAATKPTGPLRPAVPAPAAPMEPGRRRREAMSVSSPDLAPPLPAPREIPSLDLWDLA